MIEVRKLPLSFFVERLAARKPFSFVRYGDGEWLAMLGARGANCDGQNYSAALRLELQRTLLEPHRSTGVVSNSNAHGADYLYALGPKVRRDNELGRDVQKALQTWACKMDWHDSEVFLNASLAGELRPFVEQVRECEPLMVGPAHLKNLSGMLGFAGLIETPAHAAFEQVRALERDILHALTLVQTRLILFSAGPAAKVMIYNLYPRLNETHTLLDCGSLWDLYCGVNSRRYARRMDGAERARLIELNFGMDRTMSKMLDKEVA